MATTRKITAEKEAAIIEAAKLGPEAAVAEAKRQYPNGRPKAKPAGAHGDAPKPRGRRKPAAAKASTSKPAAAGKRVTGSEALRKVLADGQPHKAKDITAAAVKLVRPPMGGKTPEATLGAHLYVEAKKPDGWVMRTDNRGEFILRPTLADATPDPVAPADTEASA